MKAKLLSGFMILNLVGCSSPMPDTHYQNFSSFVGHIQKCFEAEYRLCCVIHFRSRVALLRLIVSQYGKF